MKRKVNYKSDYFKNAEVKRKRARELRRLGYTLNAIQKELGYKSISTVAYLLKYDQD
jgi:hypothetical protein